MTVLINTDVPDLSRAITFYQEALGLKLLRILDGDVAELGGGGASIFLLLKNTDSTATIAHSQRHYSRHWTPVHLDFVVEDIMSAAKIAESAGAARESDCVEWRGSKCITFSDPFGHGFCLIELTDGTYSD